MPNEVAQLLSFFEVLNINIEGVGLPLQCLGIGSYEQQLATTMLLPVAIAAVLFVGFATRSCCSGKGFVAGFLPALPWLLFLSFLVLPLVSSACFRAFSCEHFDGGRAFLRAECAQRHPTIPAAESLPLTVADFAQLLGGVRHQGA